MNIELERLEKLEEDFGIEIHVVSNMDTKINKYFYRKNDNEKWVYVTHHIDMLENYLWNKRERGEL